MCLISGYKLNYFRCNNLTSSAECSSWEQVDDFSEALCLFKYICVIHLALLVCSYIDLFFLTLLEVLLMQLQKLILSLISRNTSYKCQEVSFCMYQKKFSSAICMLAVLLLSSGSYYPLTGSLVLSHGLLHDAVCKVCFQTKHSDANKRLVKAWPVVCLLINLFIWHICV